MVAVMTDALSPISAGVIYCAVIEACYDILDVARAREWKAAFRDGARTSRISCRFAAIAWCTVLKPCG
jgi:hypothetical protein